MAREESDREDLLREATALIERVALVRRCSDKNSPSTEWMLDRIVAGFRRDGAFSIFFGDDPVYQFKVAGELRRAYCDGLLYKAVRGRLVSMKRVRTPHEVQLVRRELSEPEQAEFVERMATILRQLAAVLGADAFEVAGQHPPNVDVLRRLRSWLSSHDQWPIAVRPNA